MNPDEEDGGVMPFNQDMGGMPAEGSGAPAAGGPARPGVTDVQAYIGRQLRAVYDDVAKQPIPDRFLALMKQLEEGSTEG